MGEMIWMTMDDEAEIAVYHARPEGERRGGLVLIQEIFGVTAHIRELADGYAADGYEVIAPALFDRLAPGFEAGYGEADMAEALKVSQAARWDDVARDLQAAIDALKPPVFVAGYCWGGTATWLAACRCDGVAAASAFYGRRISELIDETPRCPIILHFGKTDPTIPLEKVDEIAARHPDVSIHRYDAGHGFVSDRSQNHVADADRLARLRTLALFSRHGGGRGDA